MRIAHVGNMAGVSTILAKAQRKLGREADVWVNKPSTLGFEHTHVFKLPKGLRWLELRSYDVLHLHAFRLLPLALETLIPGKQKIILHHHGADVLGRGAPFGARFAHHEFCNYDLTRWCDGEVLPLPVEMWPVVSTQDQGHFIHGETAPEKAGSKLVRETCKKLGIELMGMDPSRHRWQWQMAASRAVIGKISRWHGMPGMTCLEAMAMGKPVVTWISDYCKRRMPAEMPAMGTSPETLCSTLAVLQGADDLVKEIGDAGRRYVREHHNPIPIARRCLEVYA